MKFAFKTNFLNKYATYFLSFSLFITIQFAKANTQNDSTLCSLVKNIYAKIPFEGGRILRSEKKSYVVSLAVVSNNSNNSLVLRKIGIAKARRNLLIFLEGSEITTTKTLTTTDTIFMDNQKVSEFFKDEIKESSFGIVDGTEELCSWYNNDRTEFIIVIYRELKNTK